MAEIETLFLRDTRHGGSKDQARTVAAKLAEFIGRAKASIDIAIYDFRLSDDTLASTVVDALTAATGNGISVRIAYDAGKPADGSATTFAALAADPAPPGTGVWVSEHFDGTDVVTEAIAAPSGQLMHSKYVILDGQLGGPSSAVWTGSANFTDDAWTLQESNIITLVSPELAVAFRSDFDQMWTAESIHLTGKAGTGSASVGAATVGWDFAPGDGKAIDAALADSVNAARSRIILATMVLTSPPLITALVGAIERGVPVSGIYDSGQMGPIEKEWAKSAHSAVVLEQWKAVRAQLVAKKSASYTPTSKHDFMHNKVLIADSTVITGSYNFSANAEKNAENQLHLSGDDALVQAYVDYVATIVKAYA
jgi:phosphatidylserine/phosphatidylglycerophosphate/cardiolipin synthase-like enzyme